MAAGIALIPSTTIPTFLTASFTGMPCPIIRPHLKLRLCSLVQVTIISPIPANPLNVIGIQPIAPPSMDNSERPRVIRAAFALSPYPRPDEIPDARATIFFSAPHSSIPWISIFVYTRIVDEVKDFCTRSAIEISSQAATMVVGRSAATSSACVGPERATR